MAVPLGKQSSLLAGYSAMISSGNFISSGQLVTAFWPFLPLTFGSSGLGLPAVLLVGPSRASLHAVLYLLLSVGTHVCNPVTPR